MRLKSLGALPVWDGPTTVSSGEDDDCTAAGGAASPSLSGDGSLGVLPPLQIRHRAPILVSVVLEAACLMWPGRNGGSTLHGFQYCH